MEARYVEEGIGLESYFKRCLVDRVDKDLRGVEWKERSVGRRIRKKRAFALLGRHVNRSRGKEGEICRRSMGKGGVTPSGAGKGSQPRQGGVGHQSQIPDHDG
jgi:hypothetical protein